MQAWLMSCSGGFAHDIGVDVQATKGHLGVLSGHRAAFAGNKKRQSRISIPLWVPRGMQSQNPDQIRADRDQPRLVELALADAEHPCVEIDISQGESERFADAKSGAIEQEQKRSMGIWIHAATRMVDDRDGIEQAAQFFVRVNVWNEGFQRLGNGPWQWRAVDMAAGYGKLVEATEGGMLALPKAGDRTG